MSWYIRTVSVFLLVTSCASIYGDEKRDKAIAASIATRKTEAEKLQAELTAAKKGRVSGKIATTAFKNGKFDFPHRKVKEAKIAELQKKLSAISKPDEPSLRPFPDRELNVGDIYTGTFRVRQVIDATSALCVRSLLVGYAFPSRAPIFDDELVMLRGIDTAGWVDGRDVKIDTSLIATTTSTYGTVAGSSKTVVVLEPLTEAEIKTIRDSITLPAD